MRDTRERLTPLTVSLHWIVGLTIVGMIAVGLYMSENEVFSLYPLHKSTGILIFAVVLVRVVWRLINGWPEPVSLYRAWEQRLAKVVHWTLLLASVLLPVSGMLMSGAGGHGLDLYGLQLLAANPDPANPGQVIAHNETIAGLGHEAHELLAWLIIAAIVLHIAGALKHHLLDRDGTLRRMLGKTI